MRPKQFRVAATSVVACALAAPLHGELLTNGGFDLEPSFGAGVLGDAGYSALTGDQIPGWTIEAGHAATVHNTALYPTITGPYTINLDGEGYQGVNANLYQDFPSLLCAPYRLAFDWQGWVASSTPRLDVSVVDTVTGEVLVSLNTGFDANLHHEVLSFHGTGNVLRLRVRENPESGSNDNAFLVDNFSVVQLKGKGPDLNGDGAVNAKDLAMLLGLWGGCGADFDGDGVTGASDLAVMLGAWTG